ncbi:MAG TPA: cellulase family glycosylhydrolase [Candidatus Dormibacteraeota bacterium]
MSEEARAPGGQTRRQFLARSLLVGAGLAGAGCAAPGGVPPAAPGAAATGAGQFVTAQGTRFVLCGRTFPVAGTSNHYLGWASRAEVDDVLTTARRMGLNVVRSIMSCVIGSRDGGARRTLWNWRSTDDSSNLGVHGVHLLYWDTRRDTWAWNDSSVDGLGRWDYVIHRAGQLGLRLNISLLDFWQWAGGAQQIVAWFVPGYDPQTDVRRGSLFFASPVTKSVYKQWVAHVLERVNGITGVRYRDDPTIFAWDLMNEPEIDGAARDAAGAPLAQSWLTEMAAHVRSIDSNHLVTSGDEGFLDRPGVLDPAAELALRGLDFGSWHLYPDYYRVGTADAIDLVRRHGAIAAAAGKPVLLQEFGYGAQHPSQPDVYRAWLQAVASDPHSAGWLFWRLVGRVQRPPTRRFPEAEGDPLAGYALDNGEHFDIIDDASAAPATVSRTAAVLREAARRALPSPSP